MGALIAAQIVIPAMYSTAGYPGAAQAVVAFIDMNAPEAQDSGELADQLEELIEATSSITADDEAAAVQAALVENAREEVARLLEVERAAESGESVSFTGAFNAIRCQDGQWNQSQGYWDAWVADLNRQAPYIGPFMGAPLCAHWPAVTEKPKPHQQSHPDTLILQAEFDAATPYEGGERSASLMPNTSIITVQNEGTLPGNDVCSALPLPEEDQAYHIGGDIHEAQGSVQIKMRTDAVKEANRMVREMLRDQHQDM